MNVSLNSVLNAHLIRTRSMSHHSSNESYIATIQLNVNIEWPIRSEFCSSISGRCDVGCCVHIAALLWHLGVSQARDYNSLHPLSAGHFLASIDDTMQPSDVDDSDDNLTSSETDSTSDTDDSKDSEDAAI